MESSEFSYDTGSVIFTDAVNLAWLRKSLPDFVGDTRSKIHPEQGRPENGNGEPKGEVVKICRYKELTPAWT